MRISIILFFLLLTISSGLPDFLKEFGVSLQWKRNSSKWVKAEMHRAQLKNDLLEALDAAVYLYQNDDLSADVIYQLLQDLGREDLALIFFSQENLSVQNKSYSEKEVRLFLGFLAYLQKFHKTVQKLKPDITNPYIRWHRDLFYLKESRLPTKSQITALKDPFGMYCYLESYQSLKYKRFDQDIDRLRDRCVGTYFARHLEWIEGIQDGLYPDNAPFDSVDLDLLILRQIAARGNLQYSFFSKEDNPFILGQLFLGLTQTPFPMKQWHSYLKFKRWNMYQLEFLSIIQDHSDYFDLLKDYATEYKIPFQKDGIPSIKTQDLIFDTSQSFSPGLVESLNLLNSKAKNRLPRAAQSNRKTTISVIPGLGGFRSDFRSNYIFLDSGWANWDEKKIENILVHSQCSNALLNKIKHSHKPQWLVDGICYKFSKLKFSDFGYDEIQITDDFRFPLSDLSIENLPRQKMHPMEQAMYYYQIQSLFENHHSFLVGVYRRAVKTNWKIPSFKVLLRRYKGIQDRLPGYLRNP